MTIKDIYELSAVGTTVICRVFIVENDGSGPTIHRKKDITVSWDNVDDLTKTYTPDCLVIENGKLIIESSL